MSLQHSEKQFVDVAGVAEEGNSAVHLVEVVRVKVALQTGYD
jgi:hypothetical protein